jgi:hypothetical protein
MRILICRGMQQCCRLFMTRSKNTATHDIPFLFTFQQMANFLNLIRAFSFLQYSVTNLIPPSVIPLLPECHLTTQTFQLQLHVNHIIILQIMFLLLSPFWLKKLMICQSENLKQFSKLGNKFIILLLY